MQTAQLDQEIQPRIMQLQPKLKNTPARCKALRRLTPPKAALLALVLAALPAISQAQSTWTGTTSTDWNTAGNWSSGVPNGVDAQINSIPANICTVSANISANPNDIIIGNGAGVSGQVNQSAGLLQTGLTNNVGN